MICDHSHDWSIYTQKGVAAMYIPVLYYVYASETMPPVNRMSGLSILGPATHRSSPSSGLVVDCIPHICTCDCICINHFIIIEISTTLYNDFQADSTEFF